METSLIYLVPSPRRIWIDVNGSVSSTEKGCTIFLSCCGTDGDDAEEGKLPGKDAVGPVVAVVGEPSLFPEPENAVMGFGRTL